MGSWIASRGRSGGSVVPRGCWHAGCWLWQTVGGCVGVEYGGVQGHRLSDGWWFNTGVGGGGHSPVRVHVMEVQPFDHRDEGVVVQDEQNHVDQEQQVHSHPLVLAIRWRWVGMVVDP